MQETEHRFRNRLLAALPGADLDLLKPWMSLVTLAPSKILFEPGDQVDVTFFPCRPTVVSLLVPLPDGREVDAATIGHEGAVGGIISNGNKPAFGRAKVQVSGAALAVSTHRLQEVKQRSPLVADVFSRYSDFLVAQLMQSAACNAVHSLEQRCARWLLSTHDRAGVDAIPLTQEALAEMLGVQRTSITAVALRLSEQGLIQYARGKVRIVDRRGLEAQSCACYAAVEAHFKAVLPEQR